MADPREAIAAAMQSSGFDMKNFQEYEESTHAGEPSDEEDGSVPGDDSTDDGEGDDQDGPAGSDEEVPTEYFGLDLSDLPPEARKGIIDRLREQDRIIQSEKQRNSKLQRQGEDEEPRREREPEPEPEPELTLDDIMGALGYDKNDPMYDVKAEVAGPLAQRLVAVEAAFSQFIQGQQLSALEEHWDSSLDYMEKEYGTLPMSREEVFEFAADNGIADPQDAYNRIATPGRKRLSAETEKARAEALRNVKKRSSTRRPRADDGEPAASGILSDPREAALMAARQTGMDWGAALDAEH